MDHETKEFFTELEDDDVGGFVIIDTDEDEGYRIAEKWTRLERDGGDVWHTYWMPAALLEDRIERGLCEQTSIATDEQFHGILKLAGIEQEMIEA